MLDLSVFRNRIFTVSLLCSFMSFFAISTNNFIMPFYLQRALGYSAAACGGLLMIYPIVMAVTAPLSGALADKVGAEILGVIGLTVASGGMFMLSLLTDTTPIGLFAAAMVVTSLGFSIFQSPNTTLIMGSLPKDKLGSAGALNGLTRNLGMVFGISVSMTVLYGLISVKVGYHTMDLVEGRTDAFIFAMSWVYRLSMTLCLIGVGLTLLRYGQMHKKKERE